MEKHYMDKQMETTVHNSHNTELVGGFKHDFYFPFHIWIVIPTPLTNSYSYNFQDGDCTTNQL
jgi:hypothetical protein